jgi:macrolide transport system ATP-binding/permease protein
MTILWQDIRYGVRMLWKNRGLTLAAVISLGLGIGANTTIFTWVKSVLLRPLPGVVASDQLVTVHGVLKHVGNRPISVSYPDYRDFRDRNEVFDGLIAFNLNPFNLSGDAGPERIWGLLVSGNYFDVLGVRLVAGRGFLSEEDRTPGTHPVAVISYGLWQRRYGADPNLVGKAVQLNDRSFTIVGIAPKDFHGTYIGLAADVYMPMMMQPQMTPGDNSLTERNNQWLDVMGRLKPGVSRQQANASLQIIARQLAETYRQGDDGLGVDVFTLAREPNGAQQFLLPVLAILMAVAGVVLLIACANVANLLLGRATARRREIGIRLALGASRRRLIQQLLTESLILALLGGTCGLLLALWTAGTLVSFVPALGLPVWLNLTIDWRVFVFTLAVSLITGIVFGLAPALQGSKTELVSTLKDEAGAIGGGRRKSRVQNTLVVAQIALSLVALVGAGLFIRSLQNAQMLKPGFNPDHVLLTSLDVFPSGYDQTKGLVFYTQLLERIKIVPGVQSITFADKLPLAILGDTSQGASIEGYTAAKNEDLNFQFDTVGPDYFQAMNIPLAAGRDFTERDNKNAPGVVIINETMAHRYWANRNPIGQRMRLGNEQPVEIVGVAKDVKYRSLNEPPQSFMYIPMLQNYRSGMTLIIRTAGDPVTMLPRVRDEVHQMHANMALFDEKTLSEHASVALFAQRLAVKLLSIFGMLALTLAVIGLYSVMAYSVAQRTREIGIRIALGARDGNVFRLVIGHGLVLTIVGISAGFVTAVIVMRFMSSLLFGVTATDPITFIFVVLLLSAVAFIACYIPARRATKVDPLVALRYE